MKTITNNPAFTTIAVIWMIFILSLLIRIVNIEKNPAGFFCDEASIGYNAYTILTSGKDEYGITFPVFFKAFGEYKPPLYIYLTVPFVWLFGLNEYAVRLPAAIIGSFTPIAIYFLAKLLCNKRTSLLIALILGISPWHAHLTRIALDGFSLWILITTLEVYFFHKGTNNNKPQYIILSYVLFSLNFYTYRASWIFNPLLRLAMTGIYRKNILKHKKTHVMSIVIALIVLTPFLYHISQPQGWARIKQTTDFTSFPQSAINFFHHYTQYFSLDYLFLRGDAGYKRQAILRHSVPGVGQLYLWQLLFVPLGILSLLKSKNLLAKTMLFWLVFYPVAGSLASDRTPFATRSFIGVIPFCIATFYWLDSKLSRLKTRLTLKIFAFILIITLASSFFDYLTKWKYYPQVASEPWGWQYGSREIVNYFIEHQQSYDSFVMEPKFNGAYIFFNFYDPQNKCSKCIIGSVDKYNPEIKQLFALSQDTLNYLPENIYEEKKVIYYPNGEAAFKLVELNYK